MCEIIGAVIQNQPIDAGGLLHTEQVELEQNQQAVGNELTEKATILIRRSYGDQAQEEVQPNKFKIFTIKNLIQK